MDQKLEKNMTKTRDKTLLFFMRAYPSTFITVTALLFLAGLTEAIGITAFLPFLDMVLGKDDSNLSDSQIAKLFETLNIPYTFTAMAAFIASTIVIKALILWIAMKRVSATVSMIADDLRNRLMTAIMGAEWQLFLTSALGSNLNAIVMETFRSSRAFLTMAHFVSSLIQAAVYLFAAFLVSWTVCLFSIIVGLITVFALRFLIEATRKTGQTQTDVTKTMLSDMADIIQGIKPMRAMALEKPFLAFLQKQSTDLKTAEKEQLISMQSMAIAQEPMMVLAAIAGLTIMMFYGDLQGAEIALMGVLFIRMIGGINKAQKHYQRFAAEESALQSLLDNIHHTEQHADSWSGQSETPQDIQTIGLDNVSFSYGDKAILNNISLNFPVQKISVLMGPSGSGKTTILDLLCGFYKPAHGDIQINGDSLSALDLNGWRRTIGFVPQDVFLFSGSIRDNILMDRDNITDDDVQTAIKLAGAEEFINKLPHGLHEEVGEGGKKFSGGQRQRIALARAIVHKPQVLLLDEATSALDKETEQQVLKTLQSLSKTMTIIMASHSTAIQMYGDQIFKLENGQIIHEQ